MRGLVPEQLDVDAPGPRCRLRRSGRRARGCPRGRHRHDMRDSSPELSRAFARGSPAGVDVIEIGLASTDGLYCEWVLDLPGAMFTASHNPRHTTESSCAGPARDPWGRTPAWPRSETSPRNSSTAPPRSAPSSPRAPSGAGRACRLRHLLALAGRPECNPPPQGGGRCGQWHGRTHRARGARHGGRSARVAASDRAALLRTRRLLSQPRGQPARPQEPPRPPGGGRRGGCGPGPGLRR